MLLASSVAAQTPKWQDLYKVKKKDTIYGIAQKFGITIDELMQANPDMQKNDYVLKKGEQLLIPINMRDGSLICVGKGNDDWNQSAPHGAGRLMSRKEARNTIPMKDYKAAMEGIFTTCVNKNTVDEAPMAYKSMVDIVAHIGPTAEIVKVVRPVYNFKAEE